LKQDITTRKNKKQRCAMRRGIRVYKSEQEGERTTHREEKQLLASEGPCPPLTYFMAGEREVNGGEKEGGLEKKNARMKVFIGVQSVVDMSTLGYDRSWKRKSIPIPATRCSCQFPEEQSSP
jgi:hypothetical protein